MGDIKLFTGITQENYDANTMLEMAKNGNLGEVVIVGQEKGGGLFLSSNMSDMGHVHFALTLAAATIIKSEMPE